MVGVAGASVVVVVVLFLLSVLFRRKKLRPLFLLLVFTGVSGWVPAAALLATAGSAGDPPLASADFSADFSADEDLEERNMGKKWLVFFDSFWGVAGEGVVAVGLTGVAVVDVGEVGEWVEREEEEELPCCCGVAAVEAAGTGLDSGDVAGVASAEPDGLVVVVVVGSVRPFDFEGAIFSESASWHSSSRCWSLAVAQSEASGLSEELASTLLLLLLLLLLLVIALCW